MKTKNRFSKYVAIGLVGVLMIVGVFPMIVQADAEPTYIKASNSDDDDDDFDLEAHGL